MDKLGTEVENSVNNRPLTFASEGINELEALTLSHLINERRLKTFPSVTRMDQDDDRNYLDYGRINEKYQHLSKILNKWQDLWKRECLTSLRKKLYGVLPNKSLASELEVGDVVIVERTGPRTASPLGNVEEKYPRKDGSARLVKLKIKSGSASSYCRKNSITGMCCREH